MTTPESKRIRALRKSFKAERDRIKAAMEKCSVGTNVYLQHVKLLADSEARERAEEIALGLVPANLGNVMRTEFIYVSHMQVMPANREELAELLRVQAVKATKGLHLDDADEQIRQRLQEEFK